MPRGQDAAGRGADLGAFDGNHRGGRSDGDEREDRTQPEAEGVGSWGEESNKPTVGIPMEQRKRR